MNIREPLRAISPVAAVEAASERAPASRRAWRAPLAAKLAAALIGLVVLVLLVNGAINTWLGYNNAKSAALEVQEEKARSAAVRVGEFLTEIETQLGWTTGAEWRFAKPDQQRYDFVRLLRQVPAITELSYLDGQGKEQLKVSRLEPDSIGSGKDFSQDPRFTKAVADKIWFGPVEFRRGSEPYMRIALAHVGREPGVTVADVNLKLIWDVISAIRVGEKGYAFVVDDKGKLIAHPDLSLVLRDTDFSQLPQVKAALAANAAEPGASSIAAPRAGTAEIARGFDGDPVLTAYAVAPGTRWIVFVQQPLSEALASVTTSLLQTLALLGLGLLLALIVGGLLARRMVVPIRRLQQGAERLGAGDLSERLDIRTGDEIETLAVRFNQMAERIQESYGTLEAKVETRTRDLNEALQQQTATADVLGAISKSVADTAPVFETILDACQRLFGSEEMGIYTIGDDDMVRAVAWRGPRAEEARQDVTPLAESVTGRVLRERRTHHIPDLGAVPNLSPTLRDRVNRHGGASLLYAPMLWEDSGLGSIVVVRWPPRPFSDREHALLQTFADQAAIAIQNARLFNETKEALEQQKASGDVLSAISKSFADTAPVFETILDACQRLFATDELAIYLLGNDDMVRSAAGRGSFARDIGRDEVPLSQSVTGRAIRERRVQHTPNVAATPNLPEKLRDRLERLGNASTAYAPMLWEDRGIGSIVVTRTPPKPFSVRELSLLQTFANQAAIAIENARLFRETQEALQQQTATADVLKVISRSVLDLDSVLQTLIDTAVRLARGSRGTIFIQRGDVLVASAFHSNVTAALREYLAVTTWRLDGDTHPARAAREGRVVHVPDLSKLEDETTQEVRKRAAYGAGLWVPLIGERQTIGVFGVPRDEPVAFTDREIEIVKTFADQAVIAIENARLFEEVQAKTRDLEEALQQQTATSNVLQVISRSAFDLQAVLTTLAESARDLCGASFVTLFMRDGDAMRLRAESGCTPEIVKFLHEHPIRAGRETFTGRVMLSGAAVHLADVLADPDYNFGEAPRIGNYRAALGVPLLRNGEVEGVFALARPEPSPFSGRQIEMVRAFADQALIAVENARLFNEVQSRTKELAASLDDLRKAQDRLIQSEKLASLGQLTAGIAHEIKNPLNFVNNFSALSRELIDELRDVLKKAPLDAARRKEAEDLIDMVAANLDKVVGHGKRADSIVKNMLLHSREGSGERTSVSVNAMVEEALNLAYHGARAEKPGFNVTIEKSLDSKAGAAELYPQEMTRVLLNLISNGFYATTRRKQSEGKGAYEPTIAASTRDLGERVEIVIRDNGAGIPDEVKAKMFNPFFTTKPAGEGTGLGLSLSHDIVVKQHGGTLEVSTEPGSYAQFTIVLPRKGAGK